MLEAPASTPACGPSGSDPSGASAIGGVAGAIARRPRQNYNRPTRPPSGLLTACSVTVSTLSASTGASVLLAARLLWTHQNNSHDVRGPVRSSSACLLMVAWAASASIIALVSSFYSVGELANCALAASRTFSSARRSFASRFVSERELSLQDCDRPPKAVKSRLACSERRSLGPGAHRCSGPRMHKSLGPWGGKCGKLLRRPSRS